MKILHIIYDLNVGGAEILLLNLCKEILAKEPKTGITVLTIAEKGSLAKNFEDAGITVECANNPKGDFIRNFFYTIAYLRRSKPDIVHTHLWHADKCGILAAFFMNITRISTIHNFELNLSGKQLIWNIIVNRLSTKMISVSETTKKQWVSRRHFKANKITTIYNCGGFSPVNEITARSSCSPDARILAIGRISPAKGFLYAVEAFNLLHREFPGITLDIYGPFFDVNYVNQIKAAIKSGGLERKITIHEATDNPVKLFMDYDILLMPSLYEGFGMVAVEAMSCGIPVIASKIPVFEEIFDNGAAALLVEPMNAAQIAGAAKKLLSEPVLYNKLSVNGLKRSKAFSKEQTTAGYLELYHSLIG